MHRWTRKTLQAGNLVVSPAIGVFLPALLVTVPFHSAAYKTCAARTNSVAMTLPGRSRCPKYGTNMLPACSTDHLYQTQRMIGKAVASLRICPSMRRAMPRLNSNGVTTGESAPRRHLSPGLKSGPDTMRGMQKGRACEKYFDSHCDWNRLPVCMFSSPYRSRAPPRTASGVVQSLDRMSTVNAFGRIPSRQLLIV